MLNKLFHRHASLDPQASAYTNKKADHLIALGDQAEAEGKLDEACKLYRQACAIAPQYSRPRLNLGVALEALGDSEAAIESYESAIVIDAKNVYAGYNLGKLLYLR